MSFLDQIDAGPADRLVLVVPTPEQQAASAARLAKRVREIERLRRDPARLAALGIHIVTRGLATQVRPNIEDLA